jgi:spermidine/putrescine transport system permease protein
MILPLYASLEKIDPRLIEAAGDLYASPWTAFRKVTWPLSLPGVVAGTLLTFIPAAGDYINAQLLGSSPGRDDRQRHREPVHHRARLPDRQRRCRSCLMATILVLVFLYIRRAGTEDLV